MNRARLLLGVLGLGSAGSAMAGTTLGHPLGLTLGAHLGGTLGHVLGEPLGNVLPAGSAVFVVAALSLGLGIYIARRKRHR